MPKYRSIAYCITTVLYLFLWLASAEAHTIDVYFPDVDGTLSVESFEISNVENPYAAISRALLYKPTKEGLRSAIPDETTIYNTYVDRETVYIDFSKELFAYRGGTERERLLLGQIVYTVTQFPHVSSVQIAVEGQRCLAPEGSLTDRPLRREDLGLRIKRRQM